MAHSGTVFWDTIGGKYTLWRKVWCKALAHSPYRHLYRAKDYHQLM